jgi:hypothetical protein
VIILITVLFFSFSESDPLTKIISGFATYVEKFPPEKIYIHFNKPNYTAGETIWFKAYLTAGVYHEPSSLSRTIHVELIDENGRLIQHLKLFSINGSVAGTISIPDSLTSGTYLVRAHTNWMRNSGEEYFFHRSIKIWNDEIPENQANHENRMDIQFFPEGGELVHGIQHKVAFKAIGPDGLGRRMKGRVLDGARVICEFKSNALGMGAFYLTPQMGKRYTAIIENYANEIALPQVKESGLVLSVTHSSKSNDIVVKIQATDYMSTKTIFILAQTRGLVCYSARANLSTNIAVAKIPKKEFPSGISQITVTDHNGIPLAERLIFVDQKDQVTFKIATDKTTYAPRELVKLEIHATDSSGVPVLADLSLSVCDNQQVRREENGENIKAYLLLTSELTGHIESPGYYFNPSNEDREEALDYLLLTQGWRRLTFKKVLEYKWEPPVYGIEQGLTIRGKMVDLHNSKPVIDGKVSYLSMYPIPETKTVSTNSNGEFEINNIMFFDSTHVMLQGETKRGSKSIKIVLDNLYDFPDLKFPLRGLKETQNEFDNLLNVRSEDYQSIDKSYDFENKALALDEVEIRGKREDAQHTMSKTFGKGSANIKVSDNPALENQVHPLQLVQGRIAGVQVTGSGQSWSVRIQGTGSIRSGTNPLIMIDDVPVQIESLHTIPVQEIGNITVWKGADAAIFGARGANGAIGFYTKKGVRTLSPSRESSITFAGMGFQVEREFYAPQYDVQRPEHIKPDKRVTLFWAPYIRTDSSGKASVSFYNHDIETTVTGMLEGISGTGSSGAVRFEYKIVKK